MRKTICIVLAALMTAMPALAGVPKHSAKYVGGTNSEVPEKAVGVINTDDAKAMGFHWDGDLGFGTLTIPYDRISRVWYSQHIGRGVGSSVALGVSTLGVGVLPMLLSKKRQHFLTVEFANTAGELQTAEFEVGKDAIESLLASVESRTGKKIIYADEEEIKTASK